MSKGKFIVIEGLDGSGKTTQLHFIEKWIKDNLPDKTIIVTREPGGTDNPVGEQIREVILGNDMDDYTRVLLYAASRYEHSKKLKEWVDKGYIVVCDRYIYSSLAYQVSGDVELHEVLEANRYKDLIAPDLILYLKISIDTYKERKLKRQQERDLDALERKSNEFFIKAMSNYDKFFDTVICLKNVQSNCNTILREIDSNKSIEETSLQIENALKEIF